MMPSFRHTSIFLIALFSQTTDSQTAFWQQASFPTFYPGEVGAIAAKNSLVFAGCYSANSLARSTDSGKHWSQSGNFQYVYGLSIHIANSGLIFVVNGADGALFRSEDNGVTWTTCATAPFYNGATVTSGPDGCIYIASSDGIRRSADSGKTWIQKNTGLVVGSFSPYTRLASNQNGDLVAATESGIYRSSDRAESWIPLSSVRTDGFQPLTLGLNSLGYIFVSAMTSSGQIDSLYRSTDGGISWKALKPGGDRFLFIDPTNDAVVVSDGRAGQFGYSVSIDNGATWAFYPTSGDAMCLSYNGASAYFIGTSGVGILRSASLSSSWDISNTGLPGALSSVSTIQCTQSNTILAGTRSFGLYRSTDSGNDFDATSSGLGAGSPIRQIASGANGYLFAAAAGLYRSTDMGSTWFPYSDPGALYDLVPGSISTTGAIVLVGGQRAYGGAEVDRSTDAGDTWNEVYAVTGSTSEEKWVSVFPIGPSGTVLACTSYVINPSSSYSSSVYGLIRSTDGGITWAPLSVNLSKVPAVRGLVWNSRGKAFAATSAGVLSSADSGSTWTPVEGSLPTADIRCVTINRRDHIYAGTGSAGVFRSTNGGSSWDQITTGLTDPVINTIAIDSDGFLFAGTEHGGIFRSIQSTTAVNALLGVLPRSLSLRQNYPNPFNPTTTIGFTIPHSDVVTLEILDILGQRIETLVDSKLSAGSHSVNWNANRYSSGVYFYRLHIGGSFAVKRMILVK